MANIAAADVGETHGFGRFDTTGIGPYARWDYFLTSVTDAQQYDWTRAGFSAHASTVQAMLRLVEQLAPQCPEERRLIHGDFGSYNVLTDGHQITAIIDWDLAMYGDPLYDVANLLFWKEENLQPLIERVVGQHCTVPRWYERMFCYQLRIGLQEIYENVMGASPTDITWLMKRCAALVEKRAVV